MSEQDRVIEILERKGFRFVNRLSYGAVVMQKRHGSYGWTQAEIDEDGSVNGESVEDYLRGMTAKSVSAGGWGRYSEELSDILEGLVHVNRTKSTPEIFQLIKRQLIHDRPLAAMMREEGMNDYDLRELIRDNLELALIGSDGRMAMDFSTQKQYDDYMKDHPDADKSKHRVVKHDPSDMGTHPLNLMRQRKNEEKMNEIGKALKKKPEDLTNDDIIRYNKGKKAAARELLVVARMLISDKEEDRDREKFEKRLEDAEPKIKAMEEWAEDTVSRLTEGMADLRRIKTEAKAADREYDKNLNAYAKLEDSLNWYAFESRDSAKVSSVLRRLSGLLDKVENLVVGFPE